MFPFRYRSIFRSRWIALLWAGSICWTAIDVAGWSKSDEATAPAGNAATANQSSSSDADMARLEQQVRTFEDGK